VDLREAQPLARENRLVPAAPAKRGPQALFEEPRQAAQLQALAFGADALRIGPHAIAGEHPVAVDVPVAGVGHANREVVIFDEVRRTAIEAEFADGRTPEHHDVGGDAVPGDGVAQRFVGATETRTARHPRHEQRPAAFVDHADRGVRVTGAGVRLHQRDQRFDVGRLHQVVGIEPYEIVGLRLCEQPVVVGRDVEIDGLAMMTQLRKTARELREDRGRIVRAGVVGHPHFDARIGLTARALHRFDQIAALIVRRNADGDGGLIGHAR